MQDQILQVDENMLETRLDRLVSEKVEQLLNAMLDAEAARSRAPPATSAPGTGRPTERVITSVT